MLQIHPNSTQLTPKETISLSNNLYEIKREEAAVTINKIITKTKRNSIELKFPKLNPENNQDQNNKNTLNSLNATDEISRFFCRTSLEPRTRYLVHEI